MGLIVSCLIVGLIVSCLIAGSVDAGLIVGFKMSGLIVGLIVSGLIGGLIGSVKEKCYHLLYPLFSFLTSCLRENGLVRRSKRDSI